MEKPKPVVQWNMCTGIILLKYRMRKASKKGRTSGSTISFMQWSLLRFLAMYPRCDRQLYPIVLHIMMPGICALWRWIIHCKSKCSPPYRLTRTLPWLYSYIVARFIKKFTCCHWSHHVLQRSTWCDQWAPLLTRHTDHQWNVYYRQRKLNGFHHNFTVLYITGISSW